MNLIQKFEEGKFLIACTKSPRKFFEKLVYE